jgi:hypothetical protein
VRGFRNAGGGTRTPDTRIMIGASALGADAVEPYLVGFGGAGPGQICRLGDMVGDTVSGARAIRLSCPADSSANRIGSLAVRTAMDVDLDGLKVVVQLGSARLNIAPGAPKPLRVKLAKGSRRLARGKARRRAGSRTRKDATALAQGRGSLVASRSRELPGSVDRGDHVGGAWHTRIGGWSRSRADRDEGGAGGATSSQEGASMPRVEVDGVTINYDVQRGGGAPAADPLHVRRSRLLRVPTPRVRGALQLHRDRPSRLRRERQALRAVLDRGLRRPDRRLPRRHWDRGRPCRGRVARRRRGHPLGRSPSGPRALAVPAQRLARHRRLSEDRRRAVVRAGVHAADRRGRGDPGASFRGASPPRCTSNGRSSSTRWWTSCVAAPRRPRTSSWRRPTRSLPTTRAPYWARSRSRR